MSAISLTASCATDLPRFHADLLTRHPIPTIHINLDDTAFAALRLQPRAYARCAVGEDGQVYRNAGLHLKGQPGTFQNFESKPSLTLNFDKFFAGQKFHGLDKLHLNNSVSDPSYLTEIFCRELFLAAGVATGRASHARVFLSGRDAGIYVLVEGYNKTFVRHHFANAKGHLYDSEFMRDVTEPLKCSAAGGPSDRADLKALVEACAPERQSPTRRDPAPHPAGSETGAPFPKIESLLDLDRFYSFLALEMMTCHLDGYARSVNNYWLYAEPDRGSPSRSAAEHTNAFLQSKVSETPHALRPAEPQSANWRMVFIPSGMDQMFYEPQSSLLPELRGIVARAVLETTEGRAKYRERCRVLYTNLFLGLPNRIEELRAEIRPEIAKYGTNALAEHDRAVAALQQRVGRRVAFLKEALFRAGARVSVWPVVAAGVSPAATTQQLLLTNWFGTVESGRAHATERADAQVLLMVKLLPEDKPAVAIWEARVRVPRGRYRFSTNVECDQGIFRGPESPISVVLWGGDDQQFESNRIDARHIKLSQSFSIGSEQREEVVVQCRASSSEMNLEFRFSSLLLAQLP